MVTYWVRGERLVVNLDLLYERLGRVMGGDLSGTQWHIKHGELDPTLSASPWKMTSYKNR